MTDEKANKVEKININNFQQTEPLSKAVVRGGIWVFALRFTNRGLGFIRTIILARLLAPEDFGLLGIAMLAIATLETFSQTGFQAALIQKKDNVESYLDTAWTVSAIRGTILFLILFLSAPLVAGFFDSPQVVLVIRVIAISTLLSGFRNIGILYFQKELEFNKQFIYEFSATIVDLTIAITLAFILRNVWALVWGGVAANFVRFFMSYILHPYRPHVRLEKSEFKELFGFGKWVLGSSVLIFLVTQGDDIFVGKILGATALGLYQMAYLISNLPATEIAHLASQVTFPAYSKLQNDVKRLRQAYLDVLQLTAFVSIPMAGGIFILAPEFTQIFLGGKWMPMVPAMQVLVLAGLARSIANTAGTFFVATGRPQIDTLWEITRLFVLAALIYPFAMKWGLTGVSIVVFLSILVMSIGFGFTVVKITKCGGKTFLKVVFFPLISTIFMILLISTLRIGNNMVHIWKFSLFIIVGILAYFGVTYLLDRFFNYGLRVLIKESLANFMAS